VRLGLFSTADINGAILGARSADAPFEIVAVGSRDAGRAASYAREHGIARAHGSYDALLADDELDAVYIALPAKLHFDWTMRALAAGKHVLVEKPFTRDPAEADLALAEAKRRALVLAEGYMWRHSRRTKLLEELLPQVGEIQAVHASFFGILPREDDVRYVPELGGGALLDLGCYCCSAARLVLGEPTRVYGEAWLGRGGVDERFAGQLRFGDVVATFQCGFTAHANQLAVIGRDGVLLVPHVFSGGRGGVILNGEQHHAEHSDPYRLQLDDFAAAIAGGTQPLVGGDELKGQARLLDALLRSAAAGAPVPV
jgi:predicted dehydrogenase